jgi:hypothetical protein
MTARRLVVALLDDLSLTGPVQRALRALALLAAFVAWLAGALAGSDGPGLALALLLVAAAWCALTPDSHAGLVVPVAVGWQWLAQLDRTTSAWVLLAALALLVFHAATSVAAFAPAAAAPGRDVVLPVVQRTGVTAAVTALVWVAVRWSPSAGRPGHVAVTVVALTLLAAVAVTAASRTADPSRRR